MYYKLPLLVVTRYTEKFNGFKKRYHKIFRNFRTQHISAQYYGYEPCDKKLSQDLGFRFQEYNVL